MKTMLVIGLVCVLAGMVSAEAQTTTTRHHKKNSTNDMAAPGEAPPPDASADPAKQLAELQKTFVPSDPWRVVNGRTNYAKGTDWVQFEGQVTSVNGGSLVVQGWFGEPLSYLQPANPSVTKGAFVLNNYPRSVAVGQVFSRTARMVAMKSGSKNDMPNLDYATVWVPEVTEEQKTAAAQAKSKTDANVLNWQKGLAEKGDAYGEYKMGVRYLNGDGVDKDLQKARELLAKAAAQGNSDATDALAKLPPAN